jgi:uncharacterized protein YecE (DUF72 family)
MNPELRIGISGWNYTPWRGGFYPDGLIQKRELDYASRQVNSIEINGTFYSLQRPQSFRHWHDATPDDFVFSIKGNRFLTHITRLENPKTPLANFFASGLLCLGKKLGPILWQLPPTFRYDRHRLEAFFKLLPRTTEQAAQLAHDHDEKLTGRSVLTAETDQPIRHALEVRHKTFEHEEFITLLRDHNVAVVVADTAGKWPVIEDVTSDFIYLRLHGDGELYVSGYTEPALDEWARKIHRWREGGTPQGTRRFGPPAPIAKAGRAVYAYFDNDVKTHAPFDAISLGGRFGLAPQPFDPAMIKPTKKSPAA